jgi:hypothetical protein
VIIHHPEWIYVNKNSFIFNQNHIYNFLFMQNFSLNWIPKQWVLSLTLLLIVSNSMDAQIRDTQQFPMEQFMGVNIHREDPIERLKCVGFVREYHDWAVDEGNFYQASSLSSRPYPANKYSWNLQQSTSTKFDDFYKQTQLILDPTGLTRSPICATMKQCLPYLAGGDTYGTYSEIKPVDYYQSGRAKPVLGFPDANTPLGYVPIKAWKNPAAYYWIADWLYQFSRRYGSDTTRPPAPDYSPKLNRLLGQSQSETDEKGLNRVGYMELWNEPNKYWIKNYHNPLDSSWLKATQFTGAEYAAMSSAAYDGHVRTFKVISTNILSEHDYVPGVKHGDPNMKFVMGGSAGIRAYDWQFLKDMTTWFEQRRGNASKKYPFDVINFHHYNSNKWFGLAGTVSLPDYAASPEEDRWNLGSPHVNYNTATTAAGFPNEDTILSMKVVNPVGTRFRTFKQRLVELRHDVNLMFRDARHPIELWMSEFGFDTNEKSPYKAPTIYNNGVVVADQQEVQARFLVRAYLEIANSSCAAQRQSKTF